MTFPPPVDDVVELQGQYLVTFEGRKDGMLVSQRLVDMHNGAHLVPPRVAIEAFAEGSHRSVWLRYCRVLRLKTKPQHLPVYVPPLAPILDAEVQEEFLAKAAHAKAVKRQAEENARRAQRQRRRRRVSEREHGSALEEHRLTIEVRRRHPYVSYIPAACWDGLGT